MDLKDEFIQIIKRYSELSLMDTENETKKYIQEAFNASLSEGIYNRHTGTIKTRTNPRGMYLYF